MKPELQKNNKTVESSQNFDLTLDSSGSLSSYIRYVNSIPILSLEDELLFARDYRENGSKDSCQKIILPHLRVVVSIAAKFARKAKVDIRDLISEGNYALMLAIEKFDYKKGYRFVTYAIWWVRAAIEKYIKDLWNFSNNLIDSSVLKVSSGDLDSCNFIESLSDSKSSFVDELDCEIRQNQIKKIISNLPNKEKIIFIDRVYKEETLEEISGKMGISKERVRQIFTATVEKIKKSFKS